MSSEMRTLGSPSHSHSLPFPVFFLIKGLYLTKENSGQNLFQVMGETPLKAGGDSHFSSVQIVETPSFGFGS